MNAAGDTDSATRKIALEKGAVATTMQARRATGRTSRYWLIALTFAAPILLGACANPVVYNEGRMFALEEGAFDQSHPAYTFLNYAETPRAPRLKPDLIVMTLSGGGIRAAALAAAVMNELHKFEINGAPITDNVILVSSTSGGSLAAGYVAVHGFDHYADFRSQFLEKQNTKDLLLRGLGPRLFYDRSAVFQEFIEERLDLKGMTFGQLIQRHDRPFFVMNSTDLSAGEAFAFVQHDFSSICTNLNAMPISVGMTASAAIPFLLTDVELRNRNSECANQVKSEVLPAYFFDARDAVVKRYKYSLRHAFDDTAPKPQRPRPVFIHLADGGLVDNLGVGGADAADIDAASSLSAQIDPSSQVSAIRQVLVIEVNARNEKQHDDLNRDRGSPSLISMLSLTINTPIDRATSLSDGALKVGMEAVESMRPYVTDGVHVTQIDFDLIGDDEADLRRRVKGINTSLTLMPGELADLEKVAKSLLRKSGCFAQYVDRSGAKADDYISPGPDRNVTGFQYDCQ